MTTTTVISVVIIICITAVAIAFIICFFRHLSSTGFTFQRRVVSDIEELRIKLRDDIVLYDGLRGSINKMQERIKALEEAK